MDSKLAQHQYSVISSPSTPNSSLSSQTNLYGTPSSPSPATPTLQLSTPSLVGNNINSAAYTTTLNNTGGGAPGSSGHKNSLKGTKLARRARSFKDDLFEKISLMRTPTNTLGRSHSPQSPRHKNKAPPTAEEVAKSSQTLDNHVKDITNALKHFRDVILKKKLEVLPGNGTVILETIAGMFSVIQSYTLNESSTVLVSATQQVYQSLGKLIKLCDEVMLSDDTEECALLNSDNVKEIMDLLEDAVRNLANLAQQKLKEKESAFQYESSALETHAAITTANSGSPNLLMRPAVEVAGQRTSLPDITLTPKERDSLEKTNSNPMRVSHSTESILRDTSPPPKPPLPNRSKIPPPLPPKGTRQTNQSLYNYENFDLDNSTEYSLGVDHQSLRSRSPDENSSQCSLEPTRDDTYSSMLTEDEAEKMFGFKNNADGAERNGANKLKDNQNINLQNTKSTTSTANIAPLALAEATTEEDLAKTELLRKTNNHRHSNESGFVSINSFRTSTQSYSKRSSDISYQTSTKSSNSSSEFGIAMTSDNSINEEYIQQQQHQQQITTTNNKTSSICISSTSSISESSSSTAALRISDVTDNVERRISSPDQYDHHQHHQQQLQQEKIFYQQTSATTTKSSALLRQTNSLDMTTTMEEDEEEEKPALPPKRSSKECFDPIDSVMEIPELRSHHPPIDNFGNAELRPHHRVYKWPSKCTSLIEPTIGSCNTIHLGDYGQSEEPPPLPMKKKHILAYMEICSASTRSIEQQLPHHRQTVHGYNINCNITHSQTMNIATYAKDDFNTLPSTETPPALPPKIYKQWKHGSIQSNNITSTTTTTAPLPTIITTPPPSPKPQHLNSDHRILSIGTGNAELMSTVCEEIGDQCEDDQNLIHSHDLQNAYDTSKQQRANEDNQFADNKIIDCRNAGSNGDFASDVEEMVNYNNNNRKSPLAPEEINHLPNILEEVDISPYLIFKKDNEDGPEIKGGYIDALIVHASHVQKYTDKAFAEAFITTFRTFIQPIDVIEKLTHRYTVFFCQVNDQKQKAAKETFSLLVRVVNDLTCTDLASSNLLPLLVQFVYQLVCVGHLYLAKVLRNKIVEKVTLYKESRMQAYPSNDMHSTVINQPSLLDLKSNEIAEQMTLLDAELFQKIEIPEVLLFAKEQCEEKSPNLNKFTEHFNKMSYWARSKILMLSCAKEREKHVTKFIKIMKHLRKMNNYNSYLALLSALDSAPIRRLEWHKTITDPLKEYCTLIDSSSSFRAYRQALSETQPPCIPYIGLVLQDLTFVHVGNADYLKEGIINFSKRWQQYHIIDNMKRFKKCSYPFRRNERIIRFFDNFENFLGEEEMWQISETIKPRAKRQVINN